METGSQPAEALAQKSIEKELQSLQGSLWHGHVERARERIEELQWELVLTAGESENRDKLWKQLREFDGYIQNNRELIPNDGQRYRNGERISTALGGIDCEPGGEPADGEAPTNAMDGERSPPVPANADAGLERGVGRDVPPLVSQVSVPRAPGAEPPSVTPWILVLSYCTRKRPSPDAITDEHLIGLPRPM